MYEEWGGGEFGGGGWDYRCYVSAGGEGVGGGKARGGGDWGEEGRGGVGSPNLTDLEVEDGVEGVEEW